jgi:hypothetical protein
MFLGLKKQFAERNNLVGHLKLANTFRICKLATGKYTAHFK